MRLTTDQGVTFGFYRKSDTLAEIAFEKTELHAPKVNQVLNINSELWEVKAVKPSQYVKTLLVATLWLR